ncbi:DNA sulfur modification protein DndE [Filimonas zeae]|nr:DndE family protein [Filimonas zeae]MDR6340433.1 DNA sulfur modification protein DndE [Filimonas zeae]
MRIKISKRNSDIIDSLTSLYSFKSDGIIARIAFNYSLQLNKRFLIDEETVFSSDGKEWRDDRALFGTSSDEKSYSPIYKALLDQHYNMNLSEDEFVKMFKKHLDFGLEKINQDLERKNMASGFHVIYLMLMVKNGLELVSENSPFVMSSKNKREIPSYNSVIELTLGQSDDNTDVKVRINDLKEFDSCNIAIAGMVGSGKTELVKDILYQISLKTKHELKFIFFDYKGEGDPTRLKSFFESTHCKMIDLTKAPFELNPLSFVNLKDERARAFNIKSFVDFICTIATQLGASQKHILQTIITNCFDRLQNKNLIDSNQNELHPTLADVFNALQDYNEENERSPDSLDAIISDLATNIFQSSGLSYEKIYEQSLYINLPLELSDTLRQLCVFLTLKYLLAEFSSTNDTEPSEDRIKPLRFVIVIDEAHVYLKNKNASKALEDILRILRSKGVVVIMLTQGVEDYKTKNFDFASQIKIPVCLNINNKDYKLIEAFIGTPRSKQKLREVISNLESQKAVINIAEPQVIKINQFWQTLQNLK